MTGVPARRAGSQLLQNFDTGNLREVQVQEYECRTRGFLSLGQTLQIEQRVLSIAGEAQAEVKSALLKYFPDDVYIRRIIFNEQHCACPGIRQALGFQLPAAIGSARE